MRILVFIAGDAVSVQPMAPAGSAAFGDARPAVMPPGETLNGLTREQVKALGPGVHDIPDPPEPGERQE